MDDLDLIASLREMNRVLQEENNKLKKENKQLVVSLAKYEPPKQEKKEIEKEERHLWGEGETGWGRY